jgi:hypothetical protein
LAEIQLDLSGLSVMLAMPAHRDLPWQTTISLLETYGLMVAKGIHFEVRIAANCSLVDLARNKLAHQFLEHSECNRLFCVDSDIVWQAEDFLRLVALSTRMPVVGGLYPVKQDEPKFFIAIDNRGVEANDLGCIEVHGYGLGFTCLTREVMAKAAAASPKMTVLNEDRPLARIFRTGMRDGQFVGEDIQVFADLRALGIPVHLDPNISLGHVGPKVYRASAADYLTRPLPPAELPAPANTPAEGG